MDAPDVESRFFEELKEQIRTLSKEQGEAFGDAVFTGLTPEAAQQCDERRRRIRQLVDKLLECTRIP